MPPPSPAAGAADRNHCAVRCGRSERDGAHARPANEGDNRTTGAERKHCRRGWFDQSWSASPAQRPTVIWASSGTGGAGLPVDFDLFKEVEPVAQLPDNPLLIVARKAGPGEQGVDRLAESQPGQGIRWDPRRWRRTSRACFSRAPASNSYPIVVRIRPREPLRINSGAPPALHPNRNSRIASWPPCITSIRSWSFTSGPTSLIRLSDMIRISETLI
jgi:hypothetical protein